VGCVDDICLESTDVANEQRRPRVVAWIPPTRAAAMMTACGRSPQKLANGELVGQIEFTVRSKHEIGMALC